MYTAVIIYMNVPVTSIGGKHTGKCIVECFDLWLILIMGRNAKFQFKVSKNVGGSFLRASQG
jgi:hypothetical protein